MKITTAQQESLTETFAQELELGGDASTLVAALLEWSLLPEGHEMSETTDYTELIAELNFLPEFVLGTYEGKPLPLAGFTRKRIAKTLTAAAAALVQTERELDDARLVMATWRHDDADELDQLRQTLAEQAATISAERSARQSQTDELVDARRILSRLLPSTANEKGNDGE